MATTYCTTLGHMCGRRHWPAALSLYAEGREKGKKVRDRKRGKEERVRREEKDDGGGEDGRGPGRGYEGDGVTQLCCLLVFKKVFFSFGRYLILSQQLDKFV